MVYTQEEIRSQREHARKAAQQVPERTQSQRKLALKRANEVRTARAQLKRDLKAGRRSIHDLLLDPPEYVETMRPRIPRRGVDY